MRSMGVPTYAEPSWSPHRGNNYRKLGANTRAWEGVTGYAAMPVGAPDEATEKKESKPDWIMYGAIAAVVLYLYSQQ